MLPNDLETLNAVMAALNDKTTTDLEKITKVGVIYLRYLTQQQLAQLPPPVPPPVV